MVTTSLLKILNFFEIFEILKFYENFEIMNFKKKKKWNFMKFNENWNFWNLVNICIFFEILKFLFFFRVFVNRRWSPSIPNKYKTFIQSGRWIVKHLLRGHLWDKKKWHYKTDVLLQEVKFIWNFLWQHKKNVTF